MTQQLTTCLFFFLLHFDLKLFQILRDGAENEDLYEVAKLFNLHDS